MLMFILCLYLGFVIINLFFISFLNVMDNLAGMPANHPFKLIFLGPMLLFMFAVGRL